MQCKRKLDESEIQKKKTSKAGLVVRCDSATDVTEVQFLWSMEFSHTDKLRSPSPHASIISFLRYWASFFSEIWMTHTYKHTNTRFCFVRGWGPFIFFPLISVYNTEALISTPVLKSFHLGASWTNVGGMQQFSSRSQFDQVKNASAGNRTRVTSVAGIYHTTRPPMHTICPLVPLLERVKLP